MTTNLGAFGESWTVGHLTRLGYRIVERNVRYRWGEIDIVARDGAELVFIEVKCRRSSTYGSPESSITPARFSRLTRAIQTYLQEQGWEDFDHRVDVVAIEMDRSGRVVRGEVLRGVESPSN